MGKEKKTTLSPFLAHPALHLSELFNGHNLECTQTAKNGAYFIHPKNWQKSDIESAKFCVEGILDKGYQFVGLKAPKSSIGKDISQLYLLKTVHSPSLTFR